MLQSFVVGTSIRNGGASGQFHNLLDTPYKSAESEKARGLIGTRPSVPGNDISGRAVPTNTHVAVVFIGSCSGCARTQLSVQQLANLSKGVVLVVVNSSKHEIQASELGQKAQHHANLYVCADPLGQFEDEYAVKWYPQVFFLRPDGVITRASGPEGISDGLGGKK